VTAGMAPGGVPIDRLSLQVQRRRRHIRRGIVGWATTAARSYPWRQPGRTPYEVLIAELLLKRTTATAAARLYEDFLTRFPSFDVLAAAAPADLETTLSAVGLQHQRAKALKEIAALVLEQWGGCLPSGMEELLSIPHVGPYAAGAVRSFAFGQPSVIVDSNVHRIVTRLFRDSLSPKASLAEVRRVAEQLLPIQYQREFNLGLLDLGALVCRYRLPRCGMCPLSCYCDSAEDYVPD